MAHGGDGRQSQTAAGHGRRCVIWVPPETAAPSRLLTGLSQRHVPVTVLSDAPSVMFDLSLPGVLALIVVQPDRQPHLPPLLAAVRAYHPQLTLWQYRPGPAAEGGGLTHLREADHAAPPAEPEPSPPRHSADNADASAPASEAEAEADEALAEPAHAHPANGPGERDAAEADDRRAPSPFDDEPREPLLTHEELEMLLGPTHREEPPRR